jgi:hypothetical protein
MMRLKSFILMPTLIYRCTIFVAVRLLLRSGATLPRPPLFLLPAKSARH